MSGLVKDLRRHHDRLNCRVEEISGTRFKTDSERDAEIVLAMSLCWKAADEITRLTARVAELEKALNDIQACAEASAYGRYHIICHNCADTIETAKQALEPKP